MSILVTGGTGYIGSHTVVELLNIGKDIVIIDNLSNSKEEVLNRIEKITGKRPKFYKADVLDRESLKKIFSENSIESVVHFAGLKAVGESVEKPIEYYNNNITGTLTLIDVMREFNVKKIVFSSSATVYGDPENLPLTENAKVGGTTNPYGTSKLFIEQILKDVYISDNTWSVSILRYFNPIGAHSSGLLGEDPQGIPNNLVPFVSRVAIGKLQKLNIFSDEYDTHDGTGVRDYIHVVDLAKGHLKALEYINNKSGAFVHNLGTGNGYSVLDIVKTFERVNNVKVPYEIVGKRPGDIAVCYADPTKAKEELDWIAKKDLEDMCKDTWNFQKNNPNGIE